METLDPAVNASKMGSPIYLCRTCWRALALAILSLLISSSCRHASSNMQRVLHTLTNLEVLRESTTIVGIKLDGGGLLAPDAPCVLHGYRLRLNVLDGERYTISAEPVEAGATGVFALYLDESGELHYEPTIGRPAGPSSPVWQMTSGGGNQPEGGHVGRP